MDDKRINIAVVLSANDRMSAIIKQSIANSIAQFNRFRLISQKLAVGGAKAMAAGVAAGAPIVGFAEQYANQETAMLQMKAELLSDGNRLNQAMFKQLTDYAKKSTEVYGNTAEQYMSMIRVLRENGIVPKDILGGIGDSVEQLSVFFNMAPDQIGQFAARMRQDMNVMPNEMQGMMDMIARLKNAGVGKDGPEAVNEMSEAFSKAGIGVRLMGISGLQAAKDLGALMGVFIRTGLSGQTVGNNFRRIFDGMRDADKLKKVNDAAKELGITLDFYDKKGKFRGIPQMEAELAKLGGLNTTQVAHVLKPFGGKQGLSTDFIEQIAKTEVNSINDFNRKLSTQGTLAQKVAIIMSGLSKQTERTRAITVNAAAAIGETYAPDLRELLHTINSVITRIKEFVEHHKTLTKIIALSVGSFSALAFVGGSLALGISGITSAIGILGPIFSGLGTAMAFVKLNALEPLAMFMYRTAIPAMISFTAQVWANAAAWLANPATYIILAIVAAIAALIAIGILVYNNWHKIINWFEIKWIMMKASVAGLISVFKLFMDVLLGVGKVLIGVFTFDPSKIAEGARQAATAVSKIAHGGITQAFSEGAYKSLLASGAHVTREGSIELDASNIKSKKPQSVTHVHHTTINVHFNGVNPNDHAAVGNSLSSVMDKWYKKKKADELRTSYH